MSFNFSSLIKRTYPVGILFSWFVLCIIFAPAGVVLGIISVVMDENKVAGTVGLIISSIAFIILLTALSL